MNKPIDNEVDFAQTFLDIAGAQQPADMQGRSLARVLADNTPQDWRKELYYHYYEFPGPHSVRRHFGIRTDGYKLIRFYNIDEWELFDLEKDPRELQSVYDDEQYSEIRRDLAERLDALQTKYKDE